MNNTVEKKKRGRKKKEKKEGDGEGEKEIVVKKKRGRKSKIDNQQKNKPIFKDDINSDIILKLNISENTSTIKSSDNIKINNMIVNNNISNKSQICWNCSHKLTNIISMPINYVNKIYNTHGDFCCYSCALRYAYDNYTEKKYLEIKYFINNLSNESIKLPPSKYCLEIYGGPLSIDEYHNSDDIYDISLNNNIYIGHIITKKKNRIIEKKNDYVLYRNNKTNIEINNLLNNTINDKK